MAFVLHELVGTPCQHHGCTRKAVVELRSQGGGTSYGRFCRRHGEEALQTMEASRHQRREVTTYFKGQ